MLGRYDNSVPDPSSTLTEILWSRELNGLARKSLKSELESIGTDLHISLIRPVDVGDGHQYQRDQKSKHDAPEASESGSWARQRSRRPLTVMTPPAIKTVHRMPGSISRLCRSVCGGAAVMLRGWRSNWAKAILLIGVIRLDSPASLPHVCDQCASFRRYDLLPSDGNSLSMAYVRTTRRVPEGGARPDRTIAC